MLEFFPYPSGEGLSVGHVRNYVVGDVVTRYERMRGRDVLHPMGWDAFGLPAENEARKSGRHPEESTRAYAATYRRQMQLMGIAYDWSRELFSSDPEYYRWTQWIFLLLHRRGLAYRGVGRQWWCPVCATVLANEQVGVDADGVRCWRGHAGVHRRAIDQWFLRITAYADRLLADLDGLDWPDGIVAQQRQWIGRSEGVEIDFTCQQSGTTVSVFTTRPDTIFGCTALVLAPEHPAVPVLTTAPQRADVEAVVARASGRDDRQRSMRSGSAEGAPVRGNSPLNLASEGAFTGTFAVHPLTGERVPVWVAGYVLPEHGTGAVMLVPAHDERDWAFAVAHHLPVVRVVLPPGSAERTDAAQGGPDRQDAGEDHGRAIAPSAPYTGLGRLVRSGPFSGMDSDAAGSAIARHLEEKGRGRRRVVYRLRDWSVGRQRFWGAPIPIVHCRRCGDVGARLQDLPVRLPAVETVPLPGVDADGRPTSPLAAVPPFVETSCPECGGDAARETDTLDGFACSSWYFLRFASPRCADAPFDRAAVARWLPVDFYIGGAEHAVMHLLYARFWTKVLFDEGLVPFDEPFARLRSQGMILDATGAKMSKSRPEFVVTPDAAVARHGADALRAYELFVAPYDQDVAWDEEGVVGVERWLRRVWRVALAETDGSHPAERPASGGPGAAASDERTASLDGGGDARAACSVALTDAGLVRATHEAVRDVTEAIEGLRFNVAIAKLMGFTNVMAGALAADATDEALAPTTGAWEAAVQALILMLAPFAPHIADELWHRRGGTGFVLSREWPSFDPERAEPDAVEIAVQVDGVVRSRMSVPKSATDADLEAAALAEPAVVERLAGGVPVRVVVVRDRLVNVVTR